MFINPNLNYIFPLTQVCCLYMDFNTTILYKSLQASFLRHFYVNLEQVSQSSSSSSEMTATDFHKQITLLNFNKFQ